MPAGSDVHPRAGFGRVAVTRLKRSPRLDFPGKKLLVGVSLLIAMFPQVSLVSPLFEIERQLGLFDTWPGLIEVRSAQTPGFGRGVGVSISDGQ